MVSKLLVNSIAPNFNLTANYGPETLFQLLEDDWGILYSLFEDCCPDLSDNDISKIGIEFDIEKLKTVGFAKKSVNMEENLIYYDSNLEFAGSYTNSPNERVVYLISPEKKIEFAFAKSKKNGITTYSSTQPAGTIYDSLIDKIFRKIWL